MSNLWVWHLLRLYFHKNRASSVFVCFESISQNHGRIKGVNVSITVFYYRWFLKPVVCIQARFLPMVPVVMATLMVPLVPANAKFLVFVQWIETISTSKEGVYQCGRMVKCQYLLKASPSEATQVGHRNNDFQSMHTHTLQRAQQRKDRKSLLYEEFQQRLMMSTTPKGSGTKEPDQRSAQG